MSFENILLIIIVVLGLIGLLGFLISKNKKDKKEFESGTVEDVMEETRTDHQRNAGKP